MQSHVSAAPDFGGYLWYFGSLHPAFEMSCVIEYLKKQLLFLEQNIKFLRRRWVRSKNVFLSSAGLVSLVVTKKSVLRTYSNLSTWNNTCFLFYCRVTFGLRFFFERCVRYFVSLHPLFEMSCDTEYLEKNSFWFFLETWSSSFWIVYIFLKVSVQVFEKCRPMSLQPMNLPLKITLRPAQSLRIELCLACFSSCEWERCCGKFERL